MALRALCRSDGATAVEFALVLTVFLPLLFAIFEFGRALHTRNALEALTDRAVRALIVDHRESELSVEGLEEALLDDLRRQAAGLNPDFIALRLIGEAPYTVELSYPIDLLIPLFSVRTLSLVARRSEPGAGDVLPTGATWTDSPDFAFSRRLPLEPEHDALWAIPFHDNFGLPVIGGRSFEIIGGGNPRLLIAGADPRVIPGQGNRI